VVLWYNRIVYGLIYCVTNAVNGKQYVGQTICSAARRWQFHLVAALCYFSQGALHCAIRKYGAEAFKIEQIDSAESLEELNEKEVYHVARLGVYGGGYNLTPGGGQPRISEETRKKMSEAQKGRVTSVETCRKISEAQKDKVLSAEHRQKLSESMTKYYSLAENRRKQSESHKGKSHKGRDVWTYCKRGHPFSGENLYVAPSNGVQICLTCYHLRNNYRLPARLQKYVTGKEVYKKKEKTAQ